MSVMKVWPAPGHRVRDPGTGLLLTRRGATVPDNSYWRRRLADGDVLDAAPPPRPARPAKSTPRSSSAKRDSAPSPESPA